MTLSLWGAVLGTLAACGVLLAAARIAAIRTPQLALRVLPYVHSATGTRQVVPRAVPWLAAVVDRVLGGSASVERRLERAALPLDLAGFRREQVLWGGGAAVAAAALGVARSLHRPADLPVWLVVAGVAFAAGVLARDTRLTSQVKERERRVMAEFPIVADLLALSVAAGEGPVAALDRVVRRTSGELSADLTRVLAGVRSGEPVAAAFDALAARTGLPVIARFAAGIAVAVERGTPLADVLHHQAGDVREAGRRELIEVAARKEVLMMLPIVFLVLPTVVAIALFPGVVGLHLTA